MQNQEKPSWLTAEVDSTLARARENLRVAGASMDAGSMFQLRLETFIDRLPLPERIDFELAVANRLLSISEGAASEVARAKLLQGTTPQAPRGLV